MPTHVIICIVRTHVCTGYSCSCTCARIWCTLLAKVTSNAIAMCAQSCLIFLPYATMPQESPEKRALLLSLRTMVKTALGLGRGVGLAAESAVMSLSRSYLNQLTEPEKAQLQHDIRPDWLSNERISHDFWHGAPIVRAPRNSGQPTSRWASSRSTDEYIPCMKPHTAEVHEQLCKASWAAAS